MRTRIFIAGFFAAALAGLAAWPAGFAEAKSTTARPLGLQGALQGFEPGARVSYSINPEKGKPASGEAFVDADGNLALPAYNMYDAGGRMLGYNIHVEKNDSSNPFEVLMTFDSQTGKIMVQASGLNRFSDIGLQGAAAKTVNRADWAGLLQNPAAGNLDDIGRDEGFKLAFYNGNIASDAENKMSPKIIKVLAAPGGGGIPKDPALNTFSYPYGCNDGFSEKADYSFCDQPRLQGTVDKIVSNYVTALILMGQELSASMASLTLPIGALIDAKHQLEVQRDFQLMTAQAHKDYHPSEMMCRIGSFVKSVATAEDKAAYEKQALNGILNDYYHNLANSESSEGPDSDFSSRVDQFRKVYCDPADNNTGLRFMCDHDQKDGGPTGAVDKNRINKDIDYQKTLDNPLTLNLDLAYADNNRTQKTRASSADEEDVIALAKNLYWPSVLPVANSKRLKINFADFVNARSLYAMSNVAHNSYVTLAGMKSRTEVSRDPLTGQIIRGGGDFILAAMRSLYGTDRPGDAPTYINPAAPNTSRDAEIIKMMGEYPSYYAQMEFLTKKMYQQPDFYTNLMDKPVNVDRIKASLQAIQIMQNRDFFESSLRREMLTSLMVEKELSKHVEKINAGMVSNVQYLQGP